MTVFFAFTLKFNYCVDTYRSVLPT